ncbi:hypothetical protein PROFUN_01115 [Planoprotostelium fungivorum]|uniref:Eukaryotic translation initiation factor 3 subunit E n=1 Tax=Planoprotostelium fungivorum TaxID=1890364 RepID=A0A2P6NCE6_9EUKA|nr:hypothetical protein PROFUN_01115 [Planoprotostelium fungivorum]
MADHDLSQKLIGFLDPHMGILLLEFLDLKSTPSIPKQVPVYSKEEILKAKIALLEKTNMVDFQMEVFNKLLQETDTAPPEEEQKRMAQRKEIIVNQIKQFKTEEKPAILRLLKDRNLVAQLKEEKNFNLEYLKQHYDIDPRTVDTIYQRSKFIFDYGKYTKALELLINFRALTSNDNEHSLSALWGKLACEIVSFQPESALESINQLRDAIDQKTFTSPLKQLQQRTWLIHWGLFVFFNHPNGRNAIIDLFLQDRYLNAIQTTCPHILRYLTAAVIINKRRKNVLKDLVKVIQQESYVYKDPITEFLEALYVNFDFDSAQQKLGECESVLVNDLFLVSCHKEFMESARLFIFETYCRIHNCIDIGLTLFRMLSKKLGMDEEAAEKWIVNLIRNAKLDAKIDSQANTVLMGSQHPSVYQKVIERTKALSYRSYVLANNITKTEAGKYQVQEETATL